MQYFAAFSCQPDEVASGVARLCSAWLPDRSEEFVSTYRDWRAKHAATLKKLRSQCTERLNQGNSPSQAVRQSSDASGMTATLLNWHNTIPREERSAYCGEFLREMQMGEAYLEQFVKR